MNAEGTGVYSDTVDIKTKAESKSDNTGGTGGGGGGGTGGGGIGGSIGGNTNTKITRQHRNNRRTDSG